MVAGIIEDTSWGNDACPSFELARPISGERLRLWVEEENPERRESGGSRYCVCGLDGEGVEACKLATESVGEAVAFLLRFRYGVATGDRVRLKHDWHAVAGVTVPAGATGEVIEVTGTEVKVLLDDFMPGLEGWGNQLWVEFDGGFVFEEDDHALVLNAMEVIDR